MQIEARTTKPSIKRTNKRWQTAKMIFWEEF